MIQVTAQTRILVAKFLPRSWPTAWAAPEWVCSVDAG